MAVSRDETARRVGSMTAALRDEGLRLTHQRLEVVREIAATDEHPDVESVYRGVRVRVPTISLDTVYRTLATLVARGLVARVATTEGAARYDAATSPHHHYVCTRCGSMRDVVDAALDAVAVPDGVRALGSVETVEVRMRGVCAACAEKGVLP